MESGNVLDVFRKKDPGLALRLQERAERQDQWNDVFSTKLIELLDKIDSIRSETIKRLRQAEELAIAEGALYTSSKEHQRLADEHRKASSAFQAATESLVSARELAGQAEVLRKETSVLEDTGARLADSTRQLETATREMRGVIDKYDAAVAILAESRAQQDAIREKWEITGSLLREAQQELLTAQTEYRKASDRASVAAKSSINGFAELTSAKEAAEAARANADNASNLHDQARLSYVGAQDAQVSANTLAMESHQALSVAGCRLAKAENICTEAGCLLGKATSAQRDARSMLKDSVSRSDVAASQYSAARSSLLIVKRISVVIIVALVAVILTIGGITIVGHHSRGSSLSPMHSQQNGGGNQ